MADGIYPGIVFFLWVIPYWDVVTFLWIDCVYDLIACRGVTPLIGGIPFWGHPLMWELLDSVGMIFQKNASGKFKHSPGH